MKNINKDDKMGKAVFIIPIAAVALILTACIVVAVTTGHGNHDKAKNDKTKQDISKQDDLNMNGSEVENKKQSTAEVLKNTAYDIKEIVRKAENDAIELAKQEEIKASNAADSEAETNTESSDTVAEAAENGTGAAETPDGGKDKDTSSVNSTPSGGRSDSTSGGTKPSGGTASSDRNSGNSGATNSNSVSEPAKSEPPKNEYVAPGWIYYGSKAGNGMTGDQKAYLDSVIKQWTNGGVSNAYVEDLFLEKIYQEWGLPMSTAGVASNQRCLYPSLSEVPDYGLNMQEFNGIYNFEGLYTKGEYDEYGYLICYYWEAGAL
ncbi:hypothetical protein [Agathobacter sp.]